MSRIPGQVRKQRQLRAFDDEWEAIKEFSRLLKRAENKEQLIRLLKKLGNFDEEAVTKAERDILESDMKTTASLLDNLYTVSEASKIWGITANSLIKALNRTGKVSFMPYEAKQIGGGERKTWIITRAGMLRVFGRPTSEVTKVIDETERI